MGSTFAVNLNYANLKIYIHIKILLYEKLKWFESSQIKNSLKYCVFTKVKGWVKCIYAIDVLSGNKNTCHPLLIDFVTVTVLSYAKSSEICPFHALWLLSTGFWGHQIETNSYCHWGSHSPGKEVKKYVDY